MAQEALGSVQWFQSTLVERDPGGQSRLVGKDIRNEQSGLVTAIRNGMISSPAGNPLKTFPGHAGIIKAGMVAVIFVMEARS